MRQIRRETAEKIKIVLMIIVYKHRYYRMDWY